MDEINGIRGAFLSNLKIIQSEKGEVRHFLRNDSDGFIGFGEAYFSIVNYKQIKGWKMHTKMTMNITVPVGEIKFYLLNDKDKSQGISDQIVSISISSTNYKRLTIKSGIWMAFEGIGRGKNILINLADIPHDPKESRNLSLYDEKFKNFK